MCLCWHTALHKWARRGVPASSPQETGSLQQGSLSTRGLSRLIQQMQTYLQTLFFIEAFGSCSSHNPLGDFFTLCFSPPPRQLPPFLQQSQDKGPQPLLYRWTVLVNNTWNNSALHVFPIPAVPGTHELGLSFCDCRLGSGKQPSFILVRSRHPIANAAVEGLLHKQLRHLHSKLDSGGSEEETSWVTPRLTPPIHAGPQWFHCCVNGHVSGQLGRYLQPWVGLAHLVCPHLRFSFSLFLSAVGKLQLNAEHFKFKYFKSELFTVLSSTKTTQ